METSKPRAVVGQAMIHQVAAMMDPPTLGGAVVLGQGILPPGGVIMEVRQVLGVLMGNVSISQAWPVSTDLTLIAVLPGA